MFLSSIRGAVSGSSPFLLWLNSIPLCGRTMFYLPIHQLAGTESCPLSGHFALCYNSSLWIPIFYSFGYKLGNGISRSYGNSIFDFLEKPPTGFLQCLHRFHIPTHNVWGFQFLPSLPTYFFAYLLAAFIVVVLVDVKWYLLVISMSISQVTDDAEPLYVLVGHSPLSFREVSIQVICPFLHWTDQPSVVALSLDARPLWNTWFANIFS